MNTALFLIAAACPLLLLVAGTYTHAQLQILDIPSLQTHGELTFLYAYVCIIVRFIGC